MSSERRTTAWSTLILACLPGEDIYYNDDRLIGIGGDDISYELSEGEFDSLRQLFRYNEIILLKGQGCVHVHKLA